jgi:hypothetical protein
LKQLVFNLDGTIDPSQLEGYPQEVIERLTSPEFIEQAREQISEDLRKKYLEGRERTGRRESRQPVRYIHTGRTVKHGPAIKLSGRQKRQMRKVIRRMKGIL